MIISQVLNNLISSIFIIVIKFVILKENIFVVRIIKMLLNIYNFVIYLKQVTQDTNKI